MTTTSTVCEEERGSVETAWSEVLPPVAKDALILSRGARWARPGAVVKSKAGHYAGSPRL